MAAEDDVVAGGGSEEEEEEALLEAAEEVVLRWDPSDSDSFVWDSSASASASAFAEYLSAVDALISAAASSSSDLRGRAESVLPIATARLKRELRRLLLLRSTLPPSTLDLHSAPFYGVVSPSLRSISSSASSYDDSLTSSGDYRSPTSQASSPLPLPVSDFDQIVDRVIRAGRGRQLQLIYAAARGDFISKTLVALDAAGSVGPGEVLMINWEILNTKVRSWIHALNVFVKLLLTGERRICDRAALVLDRLEEEKFAQAARNGVLQLFNFADAIIAITESRHSPEKLFTVLRIYEALDDAAPHLTALFSGDVKDFMTENVEGALDRLGKAARGLIAEFRDSVRAHASSKLPRGGGIHPLAQDLIRYVRRLANYSYSLNLLLDGAVAGAGDEDTTTPLGRWTLALIASLESNIEEKSRLYKDEGLKYIFLMNNAHYIITSLRPTEWRNLLGNDWIRDRRRQIGQYTHGYLRASWTRIVSCLTDGGLSESQSRVLQVRLAKFNSAFEEICRVQAAWVVPNPKLRELLRIAVANKIIPAYRSFVERRFAVQVDSRHQQAAASYIKWTPEDLEEYVLDLFEGAPEASRRPRRKRAS